MTFAQLSKRWQEFARSAYDTYYENRGLLLIGACTFTGACMMCVVKLLSNLEDQDATTQAETPVSPLQLITARMVLTLVVTTSYMKYKQIPHPFLGPPEVRGWLMARGIFGFIGLFGAYYSAQYISLSDMTTILFLMPSVTAFLGCQILGENFSRREAFAGLTSLVGVVLIARPTFLFGSSQVTTYHSALDDHLSSGHIQAYDDSSRIPSEPVTSQLLEHGDHMRVVAICASLLSVLGLSIANIALRRIGTQAHIMHSITYFTGWCLIASVAIVTVSSIPWVLPPNPGLWLVGVIAIVVLGGTGQALGTRGYQLVSAGRGTLANYIGIVWSLALQSIFFKVKVTGLSLLGSAIVIVSAIFVTLTKETGNWSSAKPDRQSRAFSASARIADEELSLISEAQTDFDDIEKEVPLEKVSR